MKKYLYIACTFILLYACTKDDSSLIYPEDNPNFSFIEITSQTDSLSVDFGQTFVFTPTIKQKIDSKELEYIWTAILKDQDGNYLTDSEVIGNDLELNYAFTRMGSYDLRLEVKNEDYSKFKIWNIDVRVYDEGLMVIGENENGDANIAFARRLSAIDIIEGKELSFISDILAEVNPMIQIKNIVGIGKSILAYRSTQAYLYIVCRDMVYIADALTFEIITSLDIESSVPGAKIKSMSMIDAYNSQINLFTEDGRNLTLQKKEFLIYESLYYTGTYDDMYGNLFYTSGPNSYVTQINVDYDESKVWTTINYHAGSQPVNNTTGSKFPYADNERPNEYEGRNIISVGRMNGDYRAGTNYNFFTIATAKDNPLDVKIVEFYGSRSYGITTSSVNEYIAEDPITMTPQSKLIANSRYGSMYYFNGQNIYNWNPKAIAPNNQLPTTAAITLDGSKEVTCMAVSYDMKELYVGFYDSAASGELKGGLYIYNCTDIGIDSNIQPVQKFEGITTRPKQVMYKSYQQGVYSSSN